MQAIVLTRCRSSLTLYLPDENLIAVARHFVDDLAGAPGVDGNEKLWRAYVHYNQGVYFEDYSRKAMLAGNAEADFEGTGKSPRDGAKYADRAFDELSLEKP